MILPRLMPHLPKMLALLSLCLLMLRAAAHVDMFYAASICLLRLLRCHYAAAARAAMPPTYARGAAVRSALATARRAERQQRSGMRATRERMLMRGGAESA